MPRISAGSRVRGSVTPAASERPTVALVRRRAPRASARRDERKVHIPAPDDERGREPHRRAAAPRSPPRRSAGASVFAPPRPSEPRPQARPRPARPADRRAPPPRPGAGDEGGGAADGCAGSCSSPRSCSRSLLLVAAVGGYLYASSIFDKIEKIPLDDVLSERRRRHQLPHRRVRLPRPRGPRRRRPRSRRLRGGGRRALRHHAPAALRGRRGQMMSIPRDLYVPIAETGSSRRSTPPTTAVRSRLVRTVQQALGVPIAPLPRGRLRELRQAGRRPGRHHHRLPATPPSTRSSGLDVRRGRPRPSSTGPRRSPSSAPATTWRSSTARRYPTPTAISAGSQRQQKFLKAVFSELGIVKNPFTLASAADGATERAPHRRHLQPARRHPLRLAAPLARSRPGRAAHPSSGGTVRLGPVPGRARGPRGPRPVPLAPTRLLRAGARRGSGCRRGRGPP